MTSAWRRRAAGWSDKRPRPPSERPTPGTSAVQSHDDAIREQFTKQAEPFSTAPAIRDEEALRLLVEFSGAGPRDTVLDVACGPGLVACAFARHVGHATGIDLTPAMVERADALRRERGLSNATFQVGPAAPLPFESASFSIVVSRFSFHHLLDPRAVLAEMKRVSAPGGRVLVADVHVSADPEKAAAYNRMEKIRDPSHVRAMALTDLESLFLDAALGRPQAAFYDLETDLEGVLSRSFPEPGGADEIRRIFSESLAADGLGVRAHLRGGAIHFAYPIAILLARV